MKLSDIPDPDFLVRKPAPVAARLPLSKVADAMQEELSTVLQAEIARIRSQNEIELADIRAEAAEKAKAALRGQIEQAKLHIDEAEERANAALAQAQFIDQTGAKQFATWVKNYPPPPDGAMLPSMVADGSLVAWFTRYAQWLREVGENPRIPMVPR